MKAPTVIVDPPNGTPPQGYRPGWRTPRDPAQEAARLEAAARRRRELVGSYLALTEELLKDFGRQAETLPIEAQAGALRLVNRIRERRDKFRQVGPPA